ncbi:glycosyltransferase family 4 protein [Arthrobacter sp. TMP15]|uniref:glycosyltransferase family 4 protein n=1 Tax=Arthrobacter sp. TMP15 TaxID=3140789 RepID=UPI0031B9BEB4
MKRQRSRLVGEMRLLSGQGPELVPVAMVPVPGRVLHFLTNSLPHTTSGYAQRSHSILTAQQDLGAEILAVTRLGYPVQVGKIFAAGEDVVNGITYRRMIPSRLAKTADERVQQEAAELLQIALEFRPEILHTTTHFTNGLVVGAVAEALGIPWVYEVRGQLIDTWASSRTSAAKSSQRYKAFQSSETSVMRKANSVATLGRVMKAGIVAQGVPDCKIIMVPNAVGGDFLQKPETHTVARTKLGLDTGCDYIGTVSSLVDYEGMDDLIEAFALLAPGFPNLRLLIVGSGPVAPALKERVRHLNLSNIVIFTGRVPREQARVYHQALDIFVVPRKDLPVTRAVTPLKPVEALSCARPVVASDLPALREIVEDGVNGKLYGPDNIGSLAETLSCLLLDKNEMDRLGLKGRDMVLETRTWASNASVYARNYDELKDR